MRTIGLMTYFLKVSINKRFSNYFLIFQRLILRQQKARNAEIALCSMNAIRSSVVPQSLPNVGNTCYMHSGIQLLRRLKLNDIP